MKKIMLVIVLVASVLCAVSVPEQQFVELGDVSLFNGQTLENCRMGYRIMGEPNDDASNYIVYPTWHAGTSEHIFGLIKKYNFVDTSAYCIIMVDALGNGVSTSPSNSKTQAGEAFPEIRVIDMARCIKGVLDHLGIDHVHAIVGGSMGSMQGFELICEYPDLADKAVLYVSSPRNSAYDLIRREIALSMVDLGRKYDIPEKEYMKAVRLGQSVNAKTPEFFAKEMTPKEGEAYIEGFDRYSPNLYPADNFYCQTKALSYHDISWRDDYDMSKTAKRIKSDVFIIVNKQDHTVSPWEALDLAKMIHAKTLVLDNDRGHLGISYEMDRVKKAMDKFLKKKMNFRPFASLRNDKQKGSTMDTLQVKDKAPDFKLNDENGNSYTLKQFRGKRVVLYFYPKDDTPGCTKEACAFRDDYHVYTDHDIVIIGVSADDAKSHQKFKDKYDLPFILLSDPDKKVMEDYGAWGEKKLYGKSFLGVIRKTYLIDEKGEIVKIYPRVRVNGHSEAILKEFGIEE
jgi:peroxiredoxin/homoserine acetyltransferase